MNPLFRDTYSWSRPSHLSQRPNCVRGSDLGRSGRSDALACARLRLIDLVETLAQFAIQQRRETSTKNLTTQAVSFLQLCHFFQVLDLTPEFLIPSDIDVHLHNRYRHLTIATMNIDSLKDTVSNLTLYDLKAGVRKVQNGEQETCI